MNCIANIPDASLYFMQQQNIKTRVSKTISKVDDNDEQLDKVEEIESTI